MAVAAGLVAFALGVLALGLQTLPSVCWVSLALLWFGIREEAVLFVVVMGTIWAVVIGSTLGGELLGWIGYLGAAIIIAASYVGQGIERRHRESLTTSA